MKLLFLKRKNRETTSIHWCLLPVCQHFTLVFWWDIQLTKAVQQILSSNWQETAWKLMMTNTSISKSRLRKNLIINSILGTKRGFWSKRYRTICSDFPSARSAGTQGFHNPPPGSSEIRVTLRCRSVELTVHVISTHRVDAEAVRKATGYFTSAILV